MLIFIDESGDAGFRVAKGSSPVFAVAMVIFDRDDVAESTQAKLREALHRLHRRPEFKFNKCRDDVRDGFFRAVAGCEFRVRAVVVRKASIWSKHLRSDCESFYRFFVKSMLKFDNQSLRNAKVIIDGSGDREFRRGLQAYLKRHVDIGAIASVKVRDSKSEPLLQLADMCVGAIARSYRSERRDHARWRSMIEAKIAHVWNFK